MRIFFNSTKIQYSKTIFKSSIEAPFFRKIGKLKIGLNSVEGLMEIMQIRAFSKHSYAKTKANPQFIFTRFVSQFSKFLSSYINFYLDLGFLSISYTHVKKVKTNSFFLARQKRARQMKMCTCDLTGFSILPPFASCCLTGLIPNFILEKLSVQFPLQHFIRIQTAAALDEFEYKHCKVNLLVISVITNNIVNKDWQYDTDPNTVVT